MHGMQKLRLGRHIPDQPPLLCLHRGNFLRQKEHAGGALRPHEARDKKGAAGVRNQPKLGKAFHKAAVVGGNGEVAREGQIGAGAGRNPVHRAEDRLLNGPDSADDRVIALVHDGADIGQRAVALRQGLGQVLARAEPTARPSQHKGTHRRIECRVAKRRLDGERHLAIEAVQHIGTVQRERENPVALIEEKRGSGRGHAGKIVGALIAWTRGAWRSDRSAAHPPCLGGSPSVNSRHSAPTRAAPRAD